MQVAWRGYCTSAGICRTIHFSISTDSKTQISDLGNCLRLAPSRDLACVERKLGLILMFARVLIIGLIDNVLYPILVANELRFHPLAVFFPFLAVFWLLELREWSGARSF